MRILFMGTPEFAVYCLDEILKANLNVVGVVTSPDKPSGRGQRVHQSAVKKFAADKDLKTLQPKNLKSDSFQKELKELQPDISVVVAFRMLPKKVWDFPKLGTFNLHASLLPDYRGAAPINWAIVNGEKETGVTTFFLDEKIDTGNIILQTKLGIVRDDNAGSLHDKLMEAGAKLIVETLDRIGSGNVDTKPQTDVKDGKEAPKLNKENTKIDWNRQPEDIYNFVRGLNPYPVAWTFFENGEKTVRCKIQVVEIEKTEHDLSIGKLVKTKNELKVAAEHGFVLIETMQLPGKKKMPVKQLLNGLHLTKNARMC